MGGSVCCGHDEQGKYSWTATIMGIWSATGVRSWNWGGKEGVDEEDIWVWTTDVSSIYTIRLAYKAIVSNENFLKEEFFQKNVGQKCSPEVQFFVWKLSQKGFQLFKILHDTILFH